MPLVSISNSQDKKETEIRLPVVYGYVGNKNVSVLWNSGCNTTKESLISDNAIRGCNRRCVLADGIVTSFQFAL